MAKRGRKAKDEFEDLPQEFKDAAQSASVDEIKAKIKFLRNLLVDQGKA